MNHPHYRLRLVIAWLGLITGSLLLSSLASLQEVHAQSDDKMALEEALRHVSAESYSKRYVRPLMEATGAALSSGLFTRAPVNAGLIDGVDIYLGVRAFAARGGQRQFSADLTETRRVRHEGKIYRADVSYEIEDTPTALGAGEAAPVQGTASFTSESGERVEKQLSFRGPPGLLGESGFLDAALPVAVLQAGIGVQAIGTHLSVRYVPSELLPERATRRVRNARLLGGGVRHTISRWIPGIPFGIAAHGYYQELSASQKEGSGDYAQLEIWTAGMTLSKELAAVTFYAGAGASRTEMGLGYVPDRSGEPAPVPVSLSVGGAWQLRGRAGAELEVGPFALNLGYSYAGQPVFSAGAGIAL